MSSHTNDEIRGLTEEKLAVWMAQVAYDAFCNRGEHTNIDSFVRAKVSELNKSAIHPNVPVMYRSGRNEKPMLAFAGQITQVVARAAAALISEETVMEKARERDEYLKDFGGHRIHSDEEYWTTVITDYIKNGPEESCEDKER